MKPDLFHLLLLPNKFRHRITKWREADSVYFTLVVGEEAKPELGPVWVGLTGEELVIMKMN